MLRIIRDAGEHGQHQAPCGRCRILRIGLWGSGPERDEVARLLKQTGHLHTADTQLKTKDGRTGSYLLSAETVTIHGEQCVRTVMSDITERKQTETELLAAIDSVMQDTSWFGQKIVEKLASLTRNGTPDNVGPKIGDLTPRAREVLGLMAQGLTDDDIAQKMAVSRTRFRITSPRFIA